MATPSELLTSIYHVIVNGVIPAIMLSMLALSIYSTQKVHSEYRLSARAGLSAGLVLFAIYVVSSFADSTVPQLALNQRPAFDWFSCLGGAILGFSALFLARIEQLRAGLVGVFTLILAATSSVAVFSYFFASPLRDFAVFFALFSLFGFLLHLVLFPDTLREVLRY
jgi:hypothetical protein